MATFFTESLSALVYPELKTTHRLNYSGTNFRIWKTKLDFVLFDNKVEYVLTDPKPPEDDVDRHQKWVSDDNTARHIILGALHESLYYSYHKHETAKSLMDALAAFLTKPSMSRRMTKLSHYVRCRMGDDDNKPVTEHILEMGRLAMELELEGLKIPEELQAVMLMNSLPDSWDDVMSMAIMSLDRDGLDLDNVRKRVRDLGALKESFRMRDEDQGGSGSGSGSGSRKKFKGNCYSCGRYGHCRADCPHED